MSSDLRRRGAHSGAGCVLGSQDPHARTGLQPKGIARDDLLPCLEPLGNDRDRYPGARGRAAGRHEQCLSAAARCARAGPDSRARTRRRCERRAAAGPRTSGLMSLSTPFIRRPIATSLLMAGILLIGLVAFPLLPVAPLPQVDFPTILVSANLPGASPETMASAVATPLEYQFMDIPGVSQLTSQSVLGSTQITVQFDLNRDIDAAAQDIQAAIDAAAGQLPKDLPSPPSYRKINPADSPILIYAVHSDTLPLTTVDDY